MSANEEEQQDEPIASAEGFASLFPYKENLPGVVDDMLAELEKRGKVGHVCQYALPSGETVIRILNLLAEVLFPGYFCRVALDRANLPFHLGRPSARFTICWPGRSPGACSTNVSTARGASARNVKRRGAFKLFGSWKSCRVCLTSWTRMSAPPTPAIRRPPVTMR